MCRNVRTCVPFFKSGYAMSVLRGVSGGSRLSCLRHEVQLSMQPVCIKGKHKYAPHD